MTGTEQRLPPGSSRGSDVEDSENISPTRAGADGPPARVGEVFSQEAEDMTNVGGGVGASAAESGRSPLPGTAGGSQEGGGDSHELFEEQEDADVDMPGTTDEAASS